MPTYCYECKVCDERREVVRPMRDSGEPEFCDCGKRMKRNFHAEHSSVRGDFNEPIVSTSLAFNTDDLAEHRRQFPDVELKVDHAGHSVNPVFRSLTQKRRYLKERGWVDQNSYV